MTSETEGSKRAARKLQAATEGRNNGSACHASQRKETTMWCRMDEKERLGRKRETEHEQGKGSHRNKT